MDYHFIRPGRIILVILGVWVAQSNCDTITLSPQGSPEYAGIQDAVNAAASGDTILLLPGTYTGAENRRIDFAGKSLVLRGFGEAEDVTIDCEYQDCGFYFQSNEDSTAIVESITIKRGRDVSDRGGGVKCLNASPKLVNVSIRNCDNIYYSAIELKYSNAIVSASRIESNVASDAGGALLVSNSSPIFRDVQFIDNHSYYQAGAIVVSQNSGGEFINCLIQGSSTNWEGGAVYIIGDASPKFTNCNFDGNSANRGGAIYSSAAPEFYGCVFQENYANVSGGGIYIHNESQVGEAIFDSCFVIANDAGSGGGGIVVTSGGTPTLSRLTVVGNIGNNSNGAGISSFITANPIIQDCIVAFNEGPGILTGIYGSVEMSCNDVYGNTGGNYDGFVSDQTGINGNISEDPLFCNYDNWVLSLAEQSPCLPENNDCGLLMGALGMDCTLTGAEETPILDLRLLSCYPNPFNPHTTIPLQLENRAEIHVSIHDVLGRKVKTLQEGCLEAGRHEFHWRGFNEAGVEAASGVYFVVLDWPSGRVSQKIALLR